MYSVLPHSENFGIANKSTVFGSAAQRKFWGCDQKFSCAAKNFGIANKSTAFCSAAQRKKFELRTKAVQSAQPRSENFGIYQQKQLELSSAAQPDYQQKQLKLNLFFSAVQ
jgi:hypothetical protein